MSAAPVHREGKAGAMLGRLWQHGAPAVWGLAGAAGLWGLASAESQKSTAVGQLHAGKPALRALSHTLQGEHALLLNAYLRLSSL